MFYAAEALLLQIGLFFSRHSAVIAEFNRSFIQTRIVDERHFRAIRDGFNERAVGDYDYREDVPPEQSERTIRRAEAFLEAAEDWLRRQPGESA